MPNTLALANKVYSIDVDPTAVQFMGHSIRLNRVFGRVIPILGDAREVISHKFSHATDRVLMPLPEKALGYLPHAPFALKKTGGWIHCYGFEHARKEENPVEKTTARVAERLTDLGVAPEFAFGRVVRTVGPNWHQIVLEIKITG